MKVYWKKNKWELCIISAIIGIIMCLGFMIEPSEAHVYEVNVSYENIKNEQPRIITEAEKLDIFIQDNLYKFNFYGDTFKIDNNTLINLIKENYINLDILNPDNNLDLILINYLFSLEETNSEFFTNNITPNTKNKEYIIGLLNYFITLYPNVDFNIAASIANVESGFTAQSMLNVNNIFGGMSGGRLIRYKTIEYGILKYVIMLNEGYFNKGLNTVEKIGYIYNPTFNEAGVKIASPSWVMKVNRYLNSFQDYKAINSLDRVLALQQ